MILPGETIGVLGGGQLGRMFVLAARTMGYRVWVLDPDPVSPAGQVAHEHLQVEYSDIEALDRMGEACAAVTTEFEKVPAESMERLAERCIVRPSAFALRHAQDRIREKGFLRDQGLDTAPFRPAHNADEAAEAMRDIPAPALVKVATFGYDGKGQAGAADADEARQAFESLGGEPCVVEQRVALAKELSVVLARTCQGEAVCYPVGENVHRNGILDTTTVPAKVDAGLEERARGMAKAAADTLDYCGVLAVEFFVTEDGDLLINEMAPRPHNSGHYTLDAAATSQFEQQVRMLCGLPPGDTRLLSPVVMVNLLGELWQPQPDWAALLAEPTVKLHLYEKLQPRPGRKMGHVNCLAATRESAVRTATSLKTQLGIL